tara:strand:+ start:1018 stop:1668 length:651 start_codon:yes stop_codon:yes gene_type:complete
MKDLMSKLGYNFNDKSLLKRALTHKSLSSQHNERLEFLGDALLSLFVSEHLYNRFDNLDEGKLTQFKAKIVSRENLTNIAESIELSKFIKAGKGEKLVDNSIVGNTLEALIGAVYLDSSHSKTNQVLNKLLKESMLTLVENVDPKDPKSKLQEYLQKRNFQLPIYSIKLKGSKENQVDFKVLCEVRDLNISSIGRGQSRKKAELNSAEKILNKIEA